MKIRLISGSCYVAILVAFYLLKIFVHDLCFDALIYFFAAVGTFEMLRATKDKTTKAERVIVFIFALVAIPVCALCQQFLGNGAVFVALCLFVAVLALLSLLVINHEKTSLESAGVALLAAAYPTLLLSVLVLANHAQTPDSILSFAFNSDLLILFIFVVSPFADSFAYLFGRFLRKRFPRPFAPTVSPNKTLVGAIGGLVGGLVAAVILYFAYNAVAGDFASTAVWLPVYLGIGLLSAAATEFGDLLESAIKRKVELKDMGKIMPGHGGVLDRVDGTMLAAVVVYAAYLIVQMIA
ncbi:MAG: phosphatidate cytidylyltransferase [Clostridia bacterium]|nr:phosphatidate cytidylyltransferase [Clostridia bacterium]